MTDSWRQPRRLLMAALGALTVFYLLAPTIVIIPMSFTEASIMSFPPEGFSLQWYERSRGCSATWGWSSTTSRSATC